MCVGKKYTIHTPCELKNAFEHSVQCVFSHSIRFYIWFKLKKLFAQCFSSKLSFSHSITVLYLLLQHDWIVTHIYSPFLFFLFFKRKAYKACNYILTVKNIYQPVLFFMFFSVIKIFCHAEMEFFLVIHK